MRQIITFLILVSLTKSSFGQNLISDFQNIDKSVYLFWYDKYANKSVVGEFKDFIVLIEFPESDTLSYQVIDFLRLKFPKKPIKYVLHSHHHSHSISSFDPFIKKTKANIVSTKYNYDFIKEITSDTVELKKRFIEYDSIYMIQDNFNSLELHALFQNKYTVPTKEYNIFYFSRQQVLVQGCIFNKPLTYFEVINQRKKALREIIKDKKINAKFLIPTNTSKANEFVDIIPIELFEQSFSKGIDAEKFCDDWQKFSVEYLLAKSDSIGTEIKKIPRSFDYLVLSNYLIQLKKDFLRAIVLLKPLIKVYPNEAMLYERMGFCYENLGLNMEAILYYEKFISLSTDEEDIKEIQGVIKELSK
jgi:tetratricopeptide (TPR) repeat protein